MTGESAEGDLSAALALARQGDEAAFRTVYRAVAPLLLRYLRVLVGDDAEDVASEAWLQIVRALGSFRGEFDDFRGWAATIARNRAMDHHRAQRRRPVADVPIEHAPEAIAAEDPVDAALTVISTRAAINLIANLPREQAEAVMLRVVMGLDAPAAARVLGKRPGAVRVAVHRGLRRLAAMLENSAPADSASDHVTLSSAPALREQR